MNGLDALIVLPPVDETPLFAGANSLRVMLPLHPELGLELELDALEDCPNPMRCDSETGSQAIGRDGQWVPHGEPGSLVLFDGIEYDVENRASFVDSTCQEHVSWTASRPG